MAQDVHDSLHQPRVYQGGMRREIKPSVEDTRGRGRSWLDHGGLGMPVQGPASLVTCRALAEVEHATSSTAHPMGGRQCE